MIGFSLGGSTKRTSDFLKKMESAELYSGLETLAQQGVSALELYTPKETGLTAASWGYEIEIRDDGVRIHWANSHVNDGVNIAVILQYGHGTGTGGYVYGRDYINPALKPIFDEIADAVWKKVTNA
jgi:hypothetical protein